MYIYTITNLVNGKMYVGQTIQSNAKMRWYSHCNMASKNKKSYLYDSMRKYGIDKFEWKIVDVASTIDELNDLETAWASKLKSQGITLYNNRETGGNKKHSLESIQKMKQVQKLRHATQNVGGWKRIDGGAMLGKTHSKVTCLHCKKVMGVNGFFRSHGIKCKDAE
jgi:group I intron endonuclease